MKRFGLYTFILLLLLCAFSAHAADNYFPLNTGDARYFGYKAESVGKKILVNDKEYYEIFDCSRFSHYARVDENNNVYVKYPDRDEALYLKLDAGCGESWIYEHSSVRRDYVTLVSRSESVETDVGTFENCLHFSFSSAPIQNEDGSVTYIVDADYSRWYAPGVGLVKTRADDWNTVKTLTKMKINDITLPENAPAPVITRIKPSDGQADIPLDGEITLWFSCAINGTTLNADTFRVTSEKEGSVNGTFIFNTYENIFYPEKDFLPDDLITVTVTEGVEDFTGIPLQEPFSISFTTQNYIEPPLQFEEDSTAIASNATCGHFDWCDTDNDGDPDLTLVTQDGEVQHFINNNGSFTKETFFTTDMSFSSIGPGFLWRIDYNNDGLLDICCAGELRLQGVNWRAKFYKNTGQTFVEDTHNVPTNNVVYIDWADYNGDGRLDIAASSVNTGNHYNQIVSVYKNSEDGFIEEFSLQVNTLKSMVGYGITRWIDYDDDGDLDVVSVPRDKFSNMRFIRNDHGSFTVDDITVNSDIEPYDKFHCSAGDYDGDGDIDLLTGEMLLTRNGDSFDVHQFEGTWGHPVSTFVDMDGDGDLDILSGNGAMKKDALGRIRGYINYHENIGGEFSLAAAGNLKRLNRFRCAHWDDIDLDGRLDLSAITEEGFIIWYNRMPVPVSVEIDKHVIPQEISVASFPNPFNHSTTISFTLDRPGTFSLSIYNVSGQKIREIENGFIPVGKHSAVWNGVDDTGTVVSSGIYFAVLGGEGGRMAVKRMLLLK